MLEVKKIFLKLRRQVVLVMLAGLIGLIGLPTASVQAAGYYSVKGHQVEASRPYYSIKDRKIAQSQSSRPYYTTRDRNKVKQTTPTTSDYRNGDRRLSEKEAARNKANRRVDD